VQNHSQVPSTWTVPSVVHMGGARDAIVRRPERGFGISAVGSFDYAQGHARKDALNLQYVLIWRILPLSL